MALHERTCAPRGAGVGRGWAGHGISEVESQDTSVIPRTGTSSLSRFSLTFTVFVGNPLLSQLITAVRPHALTDLW